MKPANAGFIDYNNKYEYKDYSTAVIRGLLSAQGTIYTTGRFTLTAVTPDSCQTIGNIDESRGINDSTD